MYNGARDVHTSCLPAGLLETVFECLFVFWSIRLFVSVHDLQASLLAYTHVLLIVRCKIRLHQLSQQGKIQFFLIPAPTKQGHTVT
jgi:hypothetical protein